LNLGIIIIFVHIFFKLNYLRYIKRQINGFLEWIYVPFRNRISAQTFRYGACGGFNTALDIFLYFITYRFILKKEIVHLKIISISSYIAPFLLVFPITFTTGFLLSKYITFTKSTLQGRIQLFRYCVNVIVCILLNYALLRFFVEFCGLLPTLSKLITTGCVVCYSYYAQKHFTFKTVKNTIPSV